MSVVEFTCRKISEARFTLEPWPHLRIEGIFPFEYYTALLSMLPSDDKMEPLGRSTPLRRLYWLMKNSQIQPVEEFWNTFITYWALPLRKCLEAKFMVEARPLGGIGAELVHDFPGYYLGPHTDTPDKLVTGLFYLPKDMSACFEATELYLSDTPDPRGKGHKFDDKVYRPAAKSSFTPNTALFFLRTDSSFHGVRPTKKERWTLAYDLFR